MHASMSDLSGVVTTALAPYALGTGVFLISENRSPQATLAWMLAFILAPGLGVLVYIIFGRDTKAFSRQRTLLQQDLAAHALPLPVANPVTAGCGDRPARQRERQPPATAPARAAKLTLGADSAQSRHWRAAWRPWRRSF
jgi:Phospholipase_D-nuclease N-terminal